MHTLFLSNLFIVAVEVEIVTSALVLLCKMRRIFVFTVETRALSERKIFVPLCQSFLVKATNILHALPHQLVKPFRFQLSCTCSANTALKPNLI